MALPAAVEQQIDPAQVTRRQQLVHIMLHQQLQEKRAAAQGFQRAVCRYGINEFLNTGKPGCIEEEGLLFS